MIPNNFIIRSHLARKESVEAVEETLADLYKDYLPLEDYFESKIIKPSKLRGKSIDELTRITEDAIEETSQFLGIIPDEKPKIIISPKGIFSPLLDFFRSEKILGQYNDEDKTIQINSTGSLESLFSVASHEYTHFLQHKTLGKIFADAKESLSDFLEGHAVGVQNSVARTVSDATGNQMLKYKALSSEAEYLKRAYLYYADLLNISIRGSLMKDPLGIFMQEFYDDMDECGNVLDEYTVGTVYFKILEKTEGPAVYRRMLLPEKACENPLKI